MTNQNATPVHIPNNHEIAEIELTGNERQYVCVFCHKTFICLDSPDYELSNATQYVCLKCHNIRNA